MIDKPTTSAEHVQQAMAITPVNAQNGATPAPAEYLLLVLKHRELPLQRSIACNCILDGSLVSPQLFFKKDRVSAQFGNISEQVCIVHIGLVPLHIKRTSPRHAVCAGTTVTA